MEHADIEIITSIKAGLQRRMNNVASWINPLLHINSSSAHMAQKALTAMKRTFQNFDILSAQIRIKYDNTHGYLKYEGSRRELTQLYAIPLYQE